jgi:exodeoxyribonuclease VII large subunit
VKQVGSRSVWSIGEVTLAIWRRFEGIPSVWVEAELTNLGRRGQQVYFTLVDHGADGHLIDASMNAVVFDRLAVRPAAGALVQAYGRIEFWRQRSQVRMRVERMELAGEGLLLARIEELKRRLAAEGLTADERKRPLPRLPRAVGLVTSGEGAARADFLRNVRTRFPAVHVVVVRSLVQGEAAPREIVRAIRHLDARDDVEVIVLARGGGPLEDLMAFNSESVCRAVAACGTPVVSAIGHETDVTVCDLVADLRVSTPTKAAEAVVPDAAELADRLARYAAQLERGLRTATDPRRRALDHLAAGLVRGLRRGGQLAAGRVAGLDERMVAGARTVARRRAEDVAAWATALERATAASVSDRRDRLDRLDALHTLLSPTRTLARGYAIVHAGHDDRIIESREGIRSGDRLSIELRDGRIPATAGEEARG